MTVLCKNVCIYKVFFCFRFQKFPIRRHFQNFNGKLIHEDEDFTCEDVLQFCLILFKYYRKCEIPHHEYCRHLKRLLGLSSYICAQQALITLDCIFLSEQST